EGHGLAFGQAGEGKAVVIREAAEIVEARAGERLERVAVVVGGDVGEGEIVARAADIGDIDHRIAEKSPGNGGPAAGGGAAAIDEIQLQDACAEARGEDAEHGEEEAEDQSEGLYFT